MNTKELKGILDNWSVFYDNKEKDPHFHLAGEFDERNIITSRVISINDNIAETTTSKYELGFPKNNIYDLMP